MNKYDLKVLIDLVELEIQDITDFLNIYDGGSTIVIDIWVGKRVEYKNILKKLQKMLDNTLK